MEDLHFHPVDQEDQAAQGGHGVQGEAAFQEEEEGPAEGDLQAAGNGNQNIRRLKPAAKDKALILAAG